MARRRKRRISIKSSHRGKFTSYCKRKGFSGVTSACISQGKRSRTKSVRKMAVFAHNSRGWGR